MPEERIATYVILPATREEITESLEMAQHLCNVLEHWTIKTPEDELSAAELLKSTHKRWKDLDTLRQSVTKPALDAQRTINDFFRPVLKEWLEAKNQTKRIMAQAVTERQVENQRSIEAAAQGSVEALAQIKDNTPPAGVSYQEEMKIEIEDFDKIPREYLAVDWSKLKIMAKAGEKAPPGVRFERRPRVVVTGRGVA